MINYATQFQTGYGRVTYKSSKSKFVTPGRIAAASIYGGAAGYGFVIGGFPGAAAALIAVPEVITVPLILA